MPMGTSHYIKRAPTAAQGPPPRRPGAGALALDRGAPPEGRRRHHRPVELPVRHRHLRHHPGADRRQRRRGQARQQDRALAADGRAAPGGGGHPARPRAGRLRRGPRRRRADAVERRLRHVHRLYRDRPDHRRAGRQEPDRRLPGARRQEPDARARGRQRGRGRARRTVRRVRQLRPDLHAHRAAVHPRLDLRGVPRQVRRGDGSDEHRRHLRLRARPRIPGLGRPSRPRGGPRRRRPGEGSDRADRWAGEARPRTRVLRADHPRRRHPGDARRLHRDLRPRGGPVPLPLRRRGDRTRQRHRVRPQRQRLEQGLGPWRGRWRDGSTPAT